MASRKLTIKEAKLVKGVAEGKTQTQAAIDAGYSKKTATVIASENLRKPNVQEALHMELQRQGITLEKAIEPITKGLKAKRVVQIEGDFFETEVDDLDMQIKASDRALKLMGVSSKDNEGNTYNFTQVINEKGSAYNE